MNSLIENKEKILADLEPLLLQAEKENLFLHCFYQDLWFTAAELRAAHKENTYVWGPVNWELVHPQKRIGQLSKDIDSLRKAINYNMELIKSCLLMMEYKEEGFL